MLAEVLTLTLPLSVIIALRYLLVAGLAHWLFWRRDRALLRPRRLNRAPPRGRDVRREILFSLLSAPIYALPAAVAFVAWRRGGTRLYLDPGLYGYWWLPASALFYLLAQDAYYYWLHRLLHHPRLFAVAHRSHHLSREPTPFASFAFDPLEAALTAWFLPALAFLVPLNLGVALALLLLMTFAAVLNHSGVEIWPRGALAHPLGRMFITATHHDGHHRRQGTNFGLYLRAWDRLMGTDRV